MRAGESSADSRPFQDPLHRGQKVANDFLLFDFRLHDLTSLPAHKRPRIVV